MKKWIGLLLFFFWTGGVWAQNTTVSGTITDANSQAFSNGTYRIEFYTNGTVGPYFQNGTPFSPTTFFTGTLDGTGSFSLSVPSSTSITPVNTLWKFTVCPAASANCYSTNLSVTGSTMSVTSLIKPPAIQVEAAAFIHASAYSDSEIVGAPVGFTYFNLTSQSLRICTISIPCTWATVAGGAANPASPGNCLQSSNSTSTAFATASQGGSCLGLDSTAAPTTVLIPLTLSIAGPNPTIDVNNPVFGNARAVLSIPSTTATMTGGTSSVSLASAVAFQNNDGVVIYTAGNAPSISAPSAPTVTPSVAGGPIGGHRNKTLSGGSTNYSYCIVGIDNAFGYTACSATGSTSSGAATLGYPSTPVSITSLTRTGNVVAVVAASPVNAAVGGILYVNLPNETQQAPGCIFHGFFVISAYTDNEHFSYTQQCSTLAGGYTTPTNLTGGTVQTYTNNTLTGSPLCPSAETQCALYYAGGNFIKMMAPGQTTVEDYGSTFEANTTRPDYLPATAPSSAGNDYCLTTIASGAGTTSLTLANTCPSSVSGATIKMSDGPAFAAADANYPYGTLHIPAVASGGFYPITSNLTLTCNTLLQSATLDLEATLTLSGGCNWRGDQGGSGTTAPQFSWSNGQIVYVRNGAYPGVYTPQVADWSKLVFETTTNSLAVETSGTGTFNASLHYVSFAVNALNGTVQDYEGLGILFQGMSGINADHVMAGAYGPSAPSVGMTIAPLALMTSFGANAEGHLDCNGCYFNYRGWGFEDFVGTSENDDMRNVHMQAGIQPTFEYGAGVNDRFWLHGFEQDTSFVAMVGNWGANLSGSMITLPVTATTSGLTGTPALGLTIIGDSSGSIPGVNYGTTRTNVQNVITPVWNPYNTSDTPYAAVSNFSLKSMTHLSPAYSLFVDATLPTPSSGTATSGGSILAAGNWVFVYTATMPDGGVSAPSAATNTCTTTSGTETCPVTIPSAVLGAISYNWYASNGGGYSALSACWNNTSLTCNAGASGSLDGSSLLPSDSGDGPTWIGAAGMTGQQFKFVSSSANSGGTYNYGVLSGAFTANRTWTLPDISGISGVISGSTPTNNDCTKFTVTGSVVSLTDAGAECGSGGGSGANQTLSNLTSPTAINQSLLPSSAGGINIGSGPLPIGTGYFNAIQVGTTTGGGTLNVGASGSSTQNVLQIHGDSGTNNSGPGSLGLFTSPSDTLKVFLNPSAEGGFFTTTGSPAAGDSTNIFSPVGIPNYQGGTTYTILTSDRGNQVVFPSTASAATTWTIPATSAALGASFPPGFKFDAVNQNATYSITLNVTSGNFVTNTGTPTSLTIGPGQKVTLQVDQSANVFAAFAAAGNGSVTDGSGTTTAGYLASSTTVAHQIQYDYSTLDNGSGALTAVSYSSTADGTHPGRVTFNGNSTLPSLAGNSFNLLGPPAPTFTAWSLQFPSAIPANGDLMYCAVSSTNCLLTDAGYAYNAIPNADLEHSTVVFNGQTVSLGSTGNVNTGAAAGTYALNQGNGNAMTAGSLSDNGTTVSGTEPLIVTNIVDGEAPVTITTSASCTLGTASGCNATAYDSGYTFNQEATAATAITYTLPTAAKGKQFCVKNSNNGSAADTGTITIQTSASGQSIIYNGTAGASDGYIISGGAAGDAACVVGISSTQWEAYVQVGTWTVH